MDFVHAGTVATGRSGELMALCGRRNPYPGALGVIRPEVMADLLVLEGDPLQDIGVIDDPEKNMKLIMKDGRIHKNKIAA